MYELIHRYAPKTPGGRAIAAVLLSLVGVPALVLGFIGLSGNLGVALPLLCVSLIALFVSGQLTWGIVQQANMAPEASPLDGAQADDHSETAIETLRRRYAEGTISDEEFEHRLDRLLDSEETARSATSERIVE
nr:SHOCT domain-containing protein [Halohasta litorea]